MARRKMPAIWAMESKWSSSVRDVRSVTPALEALEAVGAARYAHVAINSPQDFMWFPPNRGGFGYAASPAGTAVLVS